MLSAPSPDRTPSPAQPVIALILPDSATFARPDFQSLLATAGRLALQHGYELILSSHNNDLKRFNSLLVTVDGLVFAHHAPESHTQAAKQAKVPYAAVSTPNALEQAITTMIVSLSEPIAEQA